jgi:hypothetical protein
LDQGVLQIDESLCRNSVFGLDRRTQFLAPRQLIARFLRAALGPVAAICLRSVIQRLFIRPLNAGFSAISCSDLSFSKSPAGLIRKVGVMMPALTAAKSWLF